MSIEMIYQILSKWIEAFIQTDETLKIIGLMYFWSLIEWEKSNGRFKRDHSGS